jgi:circadian clock protein KaiB
MIRPVLRPYISGQTPNSERAVANLHRICDDHFNGDCDLEVIDVLQRPEVAEEQRIFATPTLVKESPVPTRRVIGDLTEVSKVLSGLDLDHLAARRQDSGAQAGRRNDGA